jgi:hypothetical protein
MLGRPNVQADDIADLADERGVGTELPCLDGVRPVAERPPDPRDRLLRQPLLGGHRQRFG